ncbi:hypothetical protein NE237_003355 [Protea cynaroides]|uniref:Telomerase reverse transcriptase n=1 Tax=Protea cynaroides TaxID=273540 RepID=A0A9Q0KGW9_9MAGN|nr:hypothetical protein NE237_003355 [Protea cynaroides]
MKKKRRVPDVLWRLYRNRACTLADTIVSLLPLPPPSPADCWCKGCGCLGCSGDGAMSFLLRSDDPPDYHKLLNRCFVVMPDDQLQRRRAFYPECRWSQLTMVRRTIEMIMCESRQPSNLICSGYNKLSRASSVLDLLTTSPWCLLLERIGDDTMFHLLKYASIFLLHSRANYHRVAGPLVIDLMPKVQKHTSVYGPMFYGDRLDLGGSYTTLKAYGSFLGP